jgi:methylated-DNA-[protein]-cysteine S-methyltransferase
MRESASFQTTIGPITLISEDGCLTALKFGAPQETSPTSPSQLLQQAQQQVQEYLHGSRTQFDLPLGWQQINGFQKKILQLACEIPFGEVRTYGQIAAAIAKPKASRAVGAALARNPLPILIPCHRVVAASGHLTGYLGEKGIHTKKFLLELEGHCIVGEKLA